MKIPDDALILFSGAKPKFQIWGTIPGVIGILVLLYFLRSLLWTLDFLFNRPALVT